MIYVRPEPKLHGKKRQVEGVVLKGQKVVIVEDVLSTGKSVIRASRAIRDCHADILGIVSIFNYCINELKTNLSLHKLYYHSIYDFYTLVKVGIAKKYLNADEVELLTTWIRNPTRKIQAFKSAS